MQKHTHTIDATGKRAGRIAGEAAMFLMGKKDPAYKRNVLANVEVHITNADKLFMSVKKMKSKTYSRYSGYPGGLKKETLGHLVREKGKKEALRRAIYGMLPANTLRVKRMKHLVISD